jgi:hypothetical protein
MLTLFSQRIVPQTIQNWELFNRLFPYFFDCPLFLPFYRLSLQRQQRIG